MRVLGIDPGTLVMGYGVIDDNEDSLTALAYGAINAPSRSPMGERLYYIYKHLLKLVKLHHPDVAAIEQPFVAKNVKSALAIGRSQAIAILAAASQGIPVYEYSPAQIKQQVSNYGASTKEQVQEMIKLQLGLSSVPEPNDASDALAVALCHLSQIRFTKLLEREIKA
jgi:crossover junction endodeoxyribonuclease RuvC